MSIPISSEVKRVFAEGRDMAIQSKRRFDTSFLLLALYVVPNKGVGVLEDRQVNEDRLLDAMPRLRGAMEERRILEEVELRMRQIAQGASAPLVNTIHLLIALSRVRHSLAYRLLQSAELDPALVRREALSLLNRPGLRGSTRRRSHVAVSERPERETSRSVAPKEEARYEPVSRAEIPVSESEPVEPIQEELPQEDAESEETQEDTPYSLIPEFYPLLSSMGRNLTEEAYLGLIDPVIGRDSEIEQVMDILQKRRSNNPCLIGEPGVGKTAIVEGLACVLACQTTANPGDSSRILVELNTAGLLAGTQLRGAFAERLGAVKEEVKRADGNIIIFIDEIHTLIGAGAGDGPLDASNDLKASLARGEFPCIGATTLREYKKYIEGDAAMERRFQPVVVEEPSEEVAIGILEGIAPRYEEHHGVRVEAGVVMEAVRMSSRYIMDRQLPDKAISVLDLACARVSRQQQETVEVSDVVDVISSQTGIPVEKLLMTDNQRLLRLGSYLQERVLGQNDALERVAQVIRRNYAGFNSHRPMGSILMVGPTGVGKTETVKVLAEFLFHSRESFVRFDMSEYSEAHSVSKLIGAPPGYLGHDDGGLLTEAVHRRPYQVILFDEIEKAHLDVWNLFLQVLDEGHLTDSRGKKVSFSNTVIMLTSNLGSDEFEYGGGGTIGFGRTSGASAGKTASERVLSAVQKDLPLELWNRIEEKLVFHPLDKEAVAGIAKLLLAESSDRLRAERNISYEVEPSLIDFLIDAGGFDVRLGARPMRHMVRRVVEGEIASAILSGEVHDGECLTVFVEEKQVRVRIKT